MRPIILELNPKTNLKLRLLKNHRYNKEHKIMKDAKETRNCINIQTNKTLKTLVYRTIYCSIV